MRVRDADVADARGIARVHWDAFTSEHRQMGDAHPCNQRPSPEDEWVRFFESRIPLYQKDGAFLLADEEGSISGYIVASAEERLINGTEGEIKYLGVLEARRRHRFGRQLVADAARRLAALGMRSVHVIG